MPRYQAILLLLYCAFTFTAHSQDSTKLDKALSLPNKLFTGLSKKARAAEEKLDKQTEKYLSKLQNRENKLKAKLFKKDSTLAKQLFSNVSADYTALSKVPVVGKYSSVYSSRVDSNKTALQFLQGQGLTGNKELEKTLASYTSLQGKLDQTDAVRKYLKGRQALLKEKLGSLGMVKELKKYQKQVYYYNAQVKEYRAMFEDPDKLERKLMAVLSELPQFKDFFARNSQLGSLFRLPGADPSLNTASLAGLQTRASVNQLIQDRLGSSAGISQITNQARGGGAQGMNPLSQLKSKASQYSSGSYSNSDSELEQPDFKPNNQKTKPFLKRLEYGGNVQSQKARTLFPVTSDIGLTVGYKLNDKSVIGVGGSYKLGLGRGWNNIALSHQGVGLRSYVDYKLKGSFFLSGGYEQNYRTLFNSIEQLKDKSAWQSSGLIGLSKKYSISKKMKGSVQLLWDFLSYQQVPKTQAVLFRVGYSLK